MHILFLSRWYPYPPSNGSKIRVYNLLRGLGKEHSVTLFSYFQPEEGLPDLNAMKEWCTHVEVLPYRSFRPNSMHAWAGFFSSTPRAYLDTFSVEFRDKIISLLQEFKYDLVIASQIDTAGYGRYLKGIPAIFEEVEVSHIYERYHHATNIISRIRSGMTWAKHRQYLLKLFKYYKICTVASGNEKQLLDGIVRTEPKIEVIPNCIDVKTYAGDWGQPDPNIIVFTGSFRYNPNYEGALWFVNHVLPLVQREYPGIQLAITGDHANKLFPAGAGIRLTGFVDDIRPWLAKAWCSIVPIFTGGGTRLKILEAMAAGTPVVSTSKGAEGLDAQDGEHLLIADSPTDFAKAIIELRKNEQLHTEIAVNARNLVLKSFDWPIIMNRFSEIIRL